MTVLDDNGVLHISALGARALNQTLDGAKDFAPYIDQALDYWAHSGDAPPHDYPRVARIQLEPGWYICKTRPKDFPPWTTVEWLGTPFTVVHKAFRSDSQADGIFNLRGGATSCAIRQINFAATPESEGTGCAVSAVSATGANIGGVRISECNMALGINAAVGIYADGTLSAGAAGYGGVRLVHIRDCQIFAADQAAIILRSAGGISIRDCGFPSVGGRSAWVAISGAPSMKTQNVRIDCMSLGGGISLGHVENAIVTCPNLEGTNAVYFEQVNDIRFDCALIRGNVVGYHSKGVRLKATRVVGALTYNGAPWNQTNNEWVVAS